MKVYCTICCRKWDASKYVHVGSYICPKCATKMKRNIPIELGRRKKNKEEHRKRVSKVETLRAV